MNAPRGTIVRSHQQRPRLLVVDDEPAVGRMLAQAAEQCGYEASVSRASEEFRADYRAACPNAVLLDLSLGSGDGVELLRFLADEDSKALILIVSGFDRRVVDAACRLGQALGLDMGACLTKPVLVEELAAALRPAEASSAAPRGMADGDKTSD